MMKDYEMPVILGLVLGLAICALADAVMIGRLQADVEFLTAVSERNLGAVNRG